MKQAYKHNPILLSLIDPDKRRKLKAICLRLKTCGETQDFTNIKPNGEPGKRKFLDMLSYGISGISFETINDWLEATE